jgi:hypothetical protein
MIHGANPNMLVVHTGSGLFDTLPLGDKRRFAENRRQKRSAIRREKRAWPPVKLALLPEKTNEQSQARKLSKR